ncbi:hypothetical protein [Archangium sp.]|uniref:hypothetical protein n=1 Tax=Archangium sp. TaxID=1872627 RepID=UPI002D2C8906|nr:hypothetical protein [Archangium sp.]HYO59794.1 hypothetical protein [Archangium sp.]
MSKRLFGICLVWLVASLSGCNTPDTVGEEQDTGEVTAAVCGPYCPGGTYPTRYYCDFNCGSCASGINNATQCTASPACGTFNKCGPGCPPGFSPTRYYCDFNCGSCASGINNAIVCTNDAQSVCCPPPPKGSTVDRGEYGGVHHVELYYNFSSSNPSVGTLNVVTSTCSKTFNIGQIVCDGAPVSVGVSHTSFSQINITLPRSSVARNCVAFSSSQNYQYVEFNFTTPPDP